MIMGPGQDNPDETGGVFHGPPGTGKTRLATGARGPGLPILGH